MHAFVTILLVGITIFVAELGGSFAVSRGYEWRVGHGIGTLATAWMIAPLSMM